MPSLFDQTVLNGMQLSNRLVRSATHESMADPQGAPTAALAEAYARIARGGAAMLITGYAFVCPDGRSDAAGMLGIHTDDLIPRYRKLLAAARCNGVKIVMQIAHAGRQTSAKVIGARPLAPSPVTYRPSGETPREMTETDIGHVIEAFGHGARRVRESGFDGLQLHAAHGYLLSSFLCPYTNRRKDRWGGSIENRLRIIREVYERCRREVGYDFPLLIKMNGRDNMRGGLQPTEAIRIARALEAIGFDGIEVSCGIGDDGFSAVRGGFPVGLLLDDLGILDGKPFSRLMLRIVGKKLLKVPGYTKNYNLDLARSVKQAVGVPVMTVGGIEHPADMDEIIADGSADYISLSRPLIIDPAWPNKIKAGSREPSACIRCNHCLYYSLKYPLRCYYGKRVRDECVHNKR